MKAHRYRVVDVFTGEPLQGTALAVFPHATGIDDVTMQRIAKELNLAETAFLFPATRPDSAATVRIFTPYKEMVFAGHPTIGSAFVMLEEGIVPKTAQRFVLDERVGPVSVRVEGNGRGEGPMIWLRTPETHEGPTFARACCAEALGLAT